MDNAGLDFALLGQREEVLFGLTLVEEDLASSLSRADGVEEVFGLGRFFVFCFVYMCECECVKKGKG